MEVEEATELMLIADQVTVEKEEEATEMNVDQVLMEEELKVTVIVDQVPAEEEEEEEATEMNVDQVLMEEEEEEATELKVTVDQVLE